MRHDDPDAKGLAPPGLPWAAPWSAEGVIELLEPMVGPERRARLDAVLQARLGSVTVLLDAPHDPHNISAVIRSCDAFGVQQLHVLSAQALLFSQKVAQGTERWLDIAFHRSAGAALGQLHAQGFTLVSAHAGGELLPEQLAELPKVALVLGNEHRGVAPELQAAVDHSVRIPMQGFVESLNLSVSAALLLYAATRGRQGDLSAEHRRSLYARGLFLSVNRAEQILAASRAR
jgi:tRNA (guanosine-2'-O-)-methyltransferase